MSLEARLKARIAATGPISVAEYMTSALLDPEAGYYTTQAPFGTAGDFVTAPEISQMFGELVGLCLAQTWMDQGAPSAFALVEFGPGRGTLMADILRATARVPGFHAAAQVHLIEASPRLRDVQASVLAAHDVTWVDDLASVPELPMFVIANEFFDALPVRQFQRAGDLWAERQVGLKDDTLVFGLGPAQAQPVLADRLSDTQEGDVVELSPPLPALVADMSERIAARGGAALIIDYGDWRSLGDTLQAVRAHEPVPVLDTPGAADLTAHVDFEAIVLAAKAVQHSRLCPQGVFLERLGITERAQRLAQSLQGDALETHIAAHRRLTHPSEMGTLFKVLGLFPPSAPPPPGLEI